MLFLVGKLKSGSDNVDGILYLNAVYVLFVFLIGPLSSNDIVCGDRCLNI